MQHLDDDDGHADTGSPLRTTPPRTTSEPAAAFEADSLLLAHSGCFWPLPSLPICPHSSSRLCFSAQCFLAPLQPGGWGQGDGVRPPRGMGRERAQAPGGAGAWLARRERSFFLLRPCSGRLSESKARGRTPGAEKGGPESTQGGTDAQAVSICDSQPEKLTNKNKTDRTETIQ